MISLQHDFGDLLSAFQVFTGFMVRPKLEVRAVVFAAGREAPLLDSIVAPGQKKCSAVIDLITLCLAVWDPNVEDQHSAEAPEVYMTMSISDSSSASVMQVGQVVGNEVIVRSMADIYPPASVSAAIIALEVTDSRPLPTQTFCNPQCMRIYVYLLVLMLFQEPP